MSDDNEGGGSRGDNFGSIDYSHYSRSYQIKLRKKIAREKLKHLALDKTYGEGTY